MDCFQPVEVDPCVEDGEGAEKIPRTSWGKQVTQKVGPVYSTLAKCRAILLCLVVSEFSTLAQCVQVEVGQAALYIRILRTSSEL